jgi:hypothetical protein
LAEVFFDRIQALLEDAISFSQLLYFGTFVVQRRFLARYQLIKARLARNRGLCLFLECFYASDRDLVSKWGVINRQCLWTYLAGGMDRRGGERFQPR